MYTRAVNYKNAVATNVREARKAKKWTQEKLALKADLSSEFISKIERGNNNMSVGSLLRIARALGTTVVQLIQGVDEAEI